MSNTTYEFDKTTRQAIIVDAAKKLAHKFSGSSEFNYRQNVWTVIDETIDRYNRIVYYRSTTPLAKRRLYNAIARQAVIESRI